MPTVNHYFNNFENQAEQTLYHDLVIEAIRMYGQEMMYLPRNLINKDKIYLEDDQSTFTRAIALEMYIKSVDGFDGEGSMMSKFGLEIRDSVTFSIAARRFEEEVGQTTAFSRPREGDLIYFPLNNKVFEIKFVENKPFFFQFGTLPTYDCYCELFEYSSEKFDTGVPGIDRINSYATNFLNWALLDENGDMLVDPNGDYLVDDRYTIDLLANDPLQDNDEITTTANTFLDWSELNPFQDSTGVI